MTTSNELACGLTIERLKEVLSYNPNTGIFLRLLRVASNANAGDIAGGLGQDGYWRIRLDGYRHRAHRLAWFYMTGAWPSEEIDHKDLDTINNIWENLREATRAQNARNRLKPLGNTSGFKGVRWSKGNQKWQAVIGVDRKNKYLGYYETPELAYAAYCAATTIHHKEFAQLD